MQKQTITRRSMPMSRQRSSRAGLGNLLVPGLCVAWRAFWQGWPDPLRDCLEMILKRNGPALAGQLAEAIRSEATSERRNRS